MRILQPIEVLVYSGNDLEEQVAGGLTLLTQVDL